MTPIDDDRSKRHRKSGFHTVIIACLLVAGYGINYIVHGWIQRYVFEMYIPSSDSGGDDFYPLFYVLQVFWLVALLVYGRYRREFK